MATDGTEEEQVEAIKNWLSENGTSMGVGIVLVLAVVFGFRTWETQQRELGESASAVYEELVVALTVSGLGVLSTENLATGKFLANQLKQDHEDSTYAHFAAMHLAKLAVENEDLTTAAEELQWVMDHSPNDGIAIIANLRLAQVKFGQRQYDAALVQLEVVEPGAHEGSYEEMRGDIYYAMDNLAEARAAYQRAVDVQADLFNPMTKMKLDDLVAPESSITMDLASDSGEEN